MGDMGDHYKYLSTYVEDILVWTKDLLITINQLKEEYILKGVGKPEFFLGGNVDYLDKHWNNEGITIEFSAQTYIKNLIPKFRKLLNKDLKTYSTPMENDAYPELDDFHF